MTKKELRKELELLLTKTIEEVLVKKDSLIAAKVRKTTHAASKSIAKKFYKSLKVSVKKKPPVKKAKAVVKSLLGKGKQQTKK